MEEMILRDFVDERQLLMVKQYYDNGRDYECVVVNDVHVANFYPNGFFVVNAYISGNIKRGMEKTMLSYIARRLLFLNGGMKKFNDIADYLNLFCKKFINTDYYQVKERDVRDLIFELHSKVDYSDHTKLAYLKKYDFIGEAAFLTREEKSRFVRINKSLTSVEITRRAVEAAVNELVDGDKFITQQLVADMIDRSRQLVGEHWSIVENQVNTFNLDKFSTTDKMKIQKMESVASIVDAIRQAMFLEQKLTKSNLAEAARLSRMTVHRLWNEEEIQQAMQEYNSKTKGCDEAVC